MRRRPTAIEKRFKRDMETMLSMLYALTHAREVQRDVEQFSDHYVDLVRALQGRPPLHPELWETQKDKRASEDEHTTP